MVLAAILLMATARPASARGLPQVSSAADGVWSQLKVASNPVAYYSGSLTCDSRRHRAILHEAQLYTLDLDNPVAWVPLPTTGAVPSPRSESLIVYDSLADRVILHGGRTGVNSPTNETYILDFDDASGASGTWHLVVANGPPGVGYPAPRYGHAGIFDPARNELIFYGGYSSGCGYSVSVWALSLGSTPTWRNPSTSGFGGGVYESVFGYDSVRRQMVIYGGHYHVICSASSSDSWANTLAGYPLDGGSWVPRWPNSTGPIAHNRGAAGALDPSRDRLIALTNLSPLALPDSMIVTFSLATAQWDTLSPVGIGPGTATAMLYDPVDDRMLVSHSGISHSWWFLTFQETSGVAAGPSSPEPRLLPPHPNPMRDRAIVRVELARASAVNLSVVDVQGRLVAVLMNGELTAGGHDILWNARGLGGARVAPGLYFVRLKSVDGVESTRIVVSK